MFRLLKCTWDGEWWGRRWWPWSPSGCRKTKGWNENSIVFYKYLTHLPNMRNVSLFISQVTVSGMRFCMSTRANTCNNMSTRLNSYFFQLQIIMILHENCDDKISGQKKGYSRDDGCEIRSPVWETREAYQGPKSKQPWQKKQYSLPSSSLWFNLPASLTL